MKYRVYTGKPLNREFVVHAISAQEAVRGALREWKDLPQKPVRHCEPAEDFDFTCIEEYVKTNPQFQPSRGDGWLFNPFVSEKISYWIIERSW